jgi:hypothetical protein
MRRRRKRGLVTGARKIQSQMVYTRRWFFLGWMDIVFSTFGIAFNI